MTKREVTGDGFVDLFFCQDGIFIRFVMPVTDALYVQFYVFCGILIFRIGNV